MGDETMTVRQTASRPEGLDDLLVVKLGGSSAATSDLHRWIAAMEAARRPLVLVPGGGPFADTVRLQQPVIGFDDAAAHRMAIMAMELFGVALASLGTRLRPAPTEMEIVEACHAGAIAVWMPARLTLADARIPQDWTVTSDSLAAWLAAHLGGAPLALVKQVDVGGGRDLADLVAEGIVDPALPAMLSPRTQLTLAGPADLPGAAEIFARGAALGHPVRRRAQAAA